jgi:hypothetical protein
MTRALANRQIGHISNFEPHPLGKSQNPGAQLNMRAARVEATATATTRRRLSRVAAHLMRADQVVAAAAAGGDGQQQQQQQQEEEVVVVEEQALRSLCRAILAGLGSRSEEQDIVADHLVEAMLKGHDSHGVQMLSGYVRSCRAGLLRPNADVTVVGRAGALLTVDGGGFHSGGFGMVAARQATILAIEAAQHHGVAVLMLRNCHHIGVSMWLLPTVHCCVLCPRVRCFATPQCCPSHCVLPPFPARGNLRGAGGFAWALHAAVHQRQPNPSARGTFRRRGAQACHQPVHLWHSLCGS